MIERAKENWRRFKESEQGHRFQDRYRRHQENRRGRFDPRTFLSIGGGILVVVGGLIAVPGPGPGWVITFLGLGLIAGEFRPVAHFMDRVEVKFRALVRWVVGAWRSSSTAAKASIYLATLLCLTALIYVAYYLFTLLTIFSSAARAADYPCSLHSASSSTSHAADAAP